MSGGSRRLAKLEELARREEREAAGTLGSSRQAVTRQAEQVEHLRQFLREYETRFSEMLGSAHSAAHIKTHNAFTLRIEVGIEQAVARLETVRGTARHHEHLWSVKSRRLASVQRVMDRRVAQEKQRQVRRADRVLELFASRARIGGWADDDTS